MGKWLHRLSNIDVESCLADCSYCGKGVRVRLSKQGIWRCRIAHAISKKTSSIGYGYKSGICDICGRYTDKLVQDHNHDTGNLRSWICKGCNLIVGVIEKFYKGGYPDQVRYIKNHSP